MALAKSLSFAFFLFLLCRSVISPAEAQIGGFSVALIQRDSPKSPFYNHNEAPQADIIPGRSNYLMRLSIGTPPVEILAFAGTGSDLTWIQCEPCPQSQCFKQDAPLFDPKNSSTYSPISCSEGNCTYSVQYKSGFSRGNYATETFTLDSTSGQPVVLPKTIFGCGHNNGGSDFTSETTGVIGLGHGNTSLISRLGAIIAGKFSYCLVRQKSTKINFGRKGVVSGPGVVSSPMVDKDTLYYLTLEAISVGNQRLEFMSGSTPGLGGDILIDSGSLRTLLPLRYFSKLKSVMSSMIDAQPVEGVKPEGSLSELLCYNISSRPHIPEVTVHFRGADVELSPSNIFTNISKVVMCSSFRGHTSSFTVYGNIMQSNFLVGYDIERRTISFKPTDCTNN